MYQWLTSYLLGRKPSVSVNCSFSRIGDIYYRVSRGLVLGAILFIIYVNDLCGAKLIGKIILVADDSAVCYTRNTWDEISGGMNNDLNHCNGGSQVTISF